jgi:3-carboxy-cis,cis-muconate cycloisomerase
VRRAEWDALSGALAHTGGAASALADALAGLEVNPARMRANLDLTGGLIVAERVVFALSERLGRQAAHDVVAAAAVPVVTGGSFRNALLADVRVDLTAAELDTLLDPVTYVGSAEALVDRAVERYELEGAAA